MSQHTAVFSVTDRRQSPRLPRASHQGNGDNLVSQGISGVSSVSGVAGVSDGGGATPAELGGRLTVGGAEPKNPRRNAVDDAAQPTEPERHTWTSLL